MIPGRSLYRGYPQKTVALPQILPILGQCTPQKQDQGVFMTRQVQNTYCRPGKRHKSMSILQSWGETRV